MYPYSEKVLRENGRSTVDEAIVHTNQPIRPSAGECVFARAGSRVAGSVAAESNSALLVMVHCNLGEK